MSLCLVPHAVLGPVLWQAGNPIGFHAIVEKLDALTNSVGRLEQGWEKQQSSSMAIGMANTQSNKVHSAGGSDLSSALSANEKLESKQFAL